MKGSFPLTAYWQWYYGLLGQCASPPSVETFRIYTKLKLLDPAQSTTLTLRWTDYGGAEVGEAGAVTTFEDVVRSGSSQTR